MLEFELLKDDCAGYKMIKHNDVEYDFHDFKVGDITLRLDALQANDNGNIVVRIWRIDV